MNFKALGQSLLLLCPLLALLFCVSVYGQENREHKGLGAVPASERARLAERLKLYVKYERERRYGKLYDLISAREIERARNVHQDNPDLISTSETKEIYVKFRKGQLQWARPRFPALLEFIPQRSQELSYGPYAGCYEIRGWGRYSKESEERKDGADIIYACLENGDWYFSGILIETGGSYAGMETVPVERTENIGARQSFAPLHD